MLSIFQNRYPAVNAALSWCVLPSYGLLRCSGADATAFLHGQLTSNVQALAAGHSQYSGYCTPKGRLLASFLLWPHDGHWFLLLPRELCEPVRKRLSMFVLRSKVTITDVSSEHALFGICGNAAENAVTDIAGNAPQNTHQVIGASGITAIHLPVARYLLAVAKAAAESIQSTLSAAGAEQPETLWDALDIHAGIPVIRPLTQEQFVPQMVNFDLIGAVSFDKGCYPGQEIVARTHFLGKLKQRMVRARIVGDAMPQPGDKLFGATHGDQASGAIVNASTAPDDTHEVLAVVQQADIGASDVRWKTPDGPRLELQPLPYALK